MKIGLILLMLTTSATFASTIDIEPGRWENEVSMGDNPFLKQAMESLKDMPKAQREQAMAMMKKSMASMANKKTYQCITKEDLKNWEKKMEKQMNKGGAGKDCKFRLISIGKKEFKGALDCTVKSRNMTFNTTMSSTKSGVTEVFNSAKERTMKISMKWLSSECKK